MTDKLSITADQAREALEKERQERVNACATGLKELLERHNCKLDAVPVITADGRVMAQVQMAAVE